MKEYIAQRSKAFAAGLSGAIVTAVLHHAETTFGFELGSEMEGLIVSGAVGMVTFVATYWAPANKPKA